MEEAFLVIAVSGLFLRALYLRNRYERVKSVCERQAALLKQAEDDLRSAGQTHAALMRPIWGGAEPVQCDESECEWPEEVEWRN